jgi:hypothetical protein
MDTVAEPLFKRRRRKKHRDFKRVVVISDLHCGHLVGLTPPDFDAIYPEGPKRALQKIRARCWDFYKTRLDELKPIDALIVNGDAVDGKGKKSGGTEHITVDRTEQVDMAAYAIAYAEADKIVMSYGTPYHTGVDEDWEDEVAKHKWVQALKIGGHDWIDVNGLIIGYRHKVGSSTIPHGRHTQMAKERLWNLLWAERDEYPRSDVIIRSHVHYFNFCGGDGWLAMTTPGLQAYGSKLGVRAMSGTVDFGLVWFDVWSKEKWRWDKALLRFRHVKPVVLKV